MLENIFLRFEVHASFACSLSVLCALCFTFVGAEEICLSVVHEQTGRQKTQTLHCQPSGTDSFIVYINIIQLAGYRLADNVMVLFF